MLYRMHDRDKLSRFLIKVDQLGTVNLLCGPFSSPCIDGERQCRSVAFLDM